MISSIPKFPLNRHGITYISFQLVLARLWNRMPLKEVILFCEKSLNC